MISWNNQATLFFLFNCSAGNHQFFPQVLNNYFVLVWQVHDFLSVSLYTSNRFLSVRISLHSIGFCKRRIWMLYVLHAFSIPTLISSTWFHYLTSKWFLLWVTLQTRKQFVLFFVIHRNFISYLDSLNMLCVYLCQECLSGYAFRKISNKIHFFWETLA